MSENTALATVEPSNAAAEIANMGTTGAAVWSSVRGNDHKAKLATLKATTSSEPIDTMLDKTIKVQDIVLQALEMPNEETGELQSVTRTVLIDDKGKAFHAISGPLYRDVKNWIGILGMPHTWPAPLSIQVSREGTGNRKYFTAKVVD